MATNKMATNTKTTAALFLLAAVLGFVSSFGPRVLHRPNPFFRSPSAAKKEEMEVSYKIMPCPSPEEYRDIAAKVHLTLPEKLDVCSDTKHANLAKLLYYTSKLKIIIPPDWAPDLRADFIDPVAYIGKESKKLDFDLSQAESIALNKSGEVYLGGIFLQEYPLDALSVLIHEARHSSKFDPGHAACRRGDIPKSSGGCDSQFSLSPKNAGAYSYGAAFYAALGLFGENIPRPDREYLLSASLATISTRFNILPPALAQAYDLVALLSKTGNVYLLHPFLPEPVPLALSFLKEKEKVDRIEFNVKNNGLLLFTSERRVFTWTQASGFERLYASVIPENIPIIEAVRIRIPFKDYPFYSFLMSHDQDLRYYHFDTSSGEYQLDPYPTWPKNAAIPPLARFFMGFNGRSLFLGKDGQLSVAQEFAGEVPFNPRKDLQVPGHKWLQGTGGLVYESLYGVTSNGKLQFAQLEFRPRQNQSMNESDGQVEDEFYTLSESTLQAPEGAEGRKFLEGLSFRALLDNKGTLTFDAYTASHRSQWRKDALEIVDFTILRKHQIQRSGFQAADAKAEFIENCRIQRAIADPWFGIGIGLNQEGHLVVGVPGEKPCSVIGESSYSDLGLQIRSRSRSKRVESERKGPFGAAEVATKDSLWLMQESGAVIWLHPYKY